MHFVYVDDSKDETLSCFSALAIPEEGWRDALDHLVGMRQQMQASDGVYVRHEIHATDFVAGRGRLAPRFVPVGARVRLFNYILSCVVLLPGAQLFNAAFPRHQEERAFERLLNRINVNMSKSGSRAVIFSDEGKSYDAMLRRMRHFNYIPSMFGAWHGGGTTRNVKIDRILEDIVYRKSERSMFVQMADCCAYALLRRENPIQSKAKRGLHESFYILEPILVKRANTRDPAFGIIRPST
jgi:Protein of unknown function (DUF3800)